MKLPKIPEVPVSELLIGMEPRPDGQMGYTFHFRGTEVFTLLLEHNGPEWEEFLVKEFRAYLRKQATSPVRPEARAAVAALAAQLPGTGGRA